MNHMPSIYHIIFITAYIYVIYCDTCHFGGSSYIIKLILFHDGVALQALDEGAMRRLGEVG